MSNQGLNGAGPLSHEQVTQWIGEIQALKQQVTDLKRDRDAAYQAADAWQARYTTEAQQRRADREQFQQQQTRLQGEVDRLRGNPDAVLDGWEPLGEAASVGAALPASTPATLAEAQIECRQLREQLAQLVRQLQAEREAHDRTRRDLTTALGDAIDALERERQR